MKRSLPWLALLLAVGCTADRAPTPPTGTPPPSPQAAARCGGTGGFDVHGLTAVTAGMDNHLLTATARQSITVKPGVEVKPTRDKAGALVSVMLISNQGSGDYTCRCPDGCGGSCVLEWDTSNPTDVRCVGDCSDGDVCCFGCGLFSN